VLAARIAAGRPVEDRGPEAGLGQVPDGRRAGDSSPGRISVQIVYLKPQRAARRDVRIYVRGRDGALRRQL
jgi:hypothetical protein